MKKKWISAVLALVMAFEIGTVSAAAQEIDETSAKAAAEEASEADGADGSEEELQYINGIPVDYDDPDCIKYLENLKSSEEDGISETAPQLYSSSSAVTSEWNEATYYHNADVVGNADIIAGIDVSKYQADIDWDAVYEDGVEFAFIRLGYRGSSGGSLNMDGYYTTNMEGAADAGVQVGVYFFSQAITVAEAEEEANYVLDNLGDYDLDLPIAFDYEYVTNGRLAKASLSNETRTAICNAFCAVIEDAGYEACIYSNPSMLTDDLNADDIDEDYEIWLAHYTSGGAASYYDGDYFCWQCTSSASVDGISGNVDLDWWYQEYGVAGDVVKDAETGEWVYVNDDGEVDNTYTGFAKNSNGWWYIEEGVVTFEKNDVIKGTVKGTTGWWYVGGSKVQLSYTGLANYSYANGWWYINQGMVDFTANTVAKNKNGWYYVVGGKVRFEFTGLAD